MNLCYFSYFSSTQTSACFSVMSGISVELEIRSPYTVLNSSHYIVLHRVQSLCQWWIVQRNHTIECICWTFIVYTALISFHSHAKTIFMKTEQ